MTTSSAKRRTAELLTPDPIDRSALLPGDILLSVGIGDTSDAIRAFDGGAYSHALLWVGEPDEVIESTTPSVVRHRFDASLEKHVRQYVDVYRHRAAGDKAPEIVEKAVRYVGQKYGFGDLALAAALVATTSWFRTEKAQEAALLVASGLARLFKGTSDKKVTVVTCTELVVRAYYEAGVPIRVEPMGGDRYDAEALRKVGKASRELLGSKGVDEEELTLATCLELYRELPKLPPLEVRVKAAPAAPTPQRLGAMDAGGAWNANLVTPYYLQTSPDLELRGRLYEAPGRAR